MSKRQKSEPPASAPLPTLVFEPLDTVAFARASAVCLGTGRFLRAVLAPALSEIGCEIVFAQARGTSFGKYMHERVLAAEVGSRPTYEVDTILADGAALSTKHAVAACGSLGIAEGRSAFLELPSKLNSLRYIGLGLTEAGIVHNGPAILDLAEFLFRCFEARRGAEVCVRVASPAPSPGDAVMSQSRKVFVVPLTRLWFPNRRRSRFSTPTTFRSTATPSATTCVAVTSRRPPPPPRNS